MQQEKDTNSHTYLIFLCLSRDRKGVTAFKETLAHEPHHTSPIILPDYSPSHSSVASVGSRCSSLIHTRWAWPTQHESGKLTCTQACFSSSKGNVKPGQNPSLPLARITAQKQWLWGKAGGQQSWSPDLSFHTVFPQLLCQGPGLCACPCPSGGLCRGAGRARWVCGGFETLGNNSSQPPLQFYKPHPQSSFCPVLLEQKPPELRAPLGISRCVRSRPFQPTAATLLTQQTLHLDPKTTHYLALWCVTLELCFQR